MTTSISVSETFTRTHAKHLASKVVSDLYQCHSFYDQPSETDIADYQEELIVLLAGGYVSAYEFGFSRNDQRVVSWRYQINSAGDLVGGADDRSGGIYARADVSGAAYFNFLTYGAAWSYLTDDEKRTVNAGHSVQRVTGDPPVDGYGYWSTDRTYMSGGVTIERRTFRPL